MKVLKEEVNFLAIEEEHSSYDKSAIVIVSAPYEHTVSYGGGTKEGPKAILEASAFVEFYDDEFDNELCFEQGIATLEELDFAGKVDKDMLDYLEQQVATHLVNGKFVVTLGGEHTISTGPISAHFDKFPNMSVLQFDAHSDLRQTYQDSRYSHACIMARVAEFFPNNRIFQVGIRAQCIEESIMIKDHSISTYYASGIKREIYGKDWIAEMVSKMTDEVYVTFDVDYFDPAIMPATGTPEPDGFLYNDALQIFREINKQGKKLIGFDIVELSPKVGLEHCNLTTARLLYKMLNFAFETK